MAIQYVSRVKQRREHQVTGEAAEDNLQFEAAPSKLIFPHISNVHYIFSVLQ